MLIVVFSGYIFSTNESIDELFQFWIGMKQWTKLIPATKQINIVLNNKDKYWIPK